METYVSSAQRLAHRDELQQAAERSTARVERMSEDVLWIRSYVLAETEDPWARSASTRHEPRGDPRHAYARLARRRDRRRRRHRPVVRPDLATRWRRDQRDDASERRGLDE